MNLKAGIDKDAGFLFSFLHVITNDVFAHKL